MDQTLRVRLLGPVAAWCGDVRLDLGPGRRRAVLAVLAMRAGQVLSHEVLIDAVWGESAPAGADNSLYSYISRLRQALGPARERLISVGSGYALQLEPGALDVHEFDQFRQVARLCWSRRDITGARAALDDGLALWHGDALEDVDSSFATSHRKRLAELRLAALELRAETMIASSDAAAVPELYRLAKEYPLRETICGLLMTALHRGDRESDALKVFHETRQMLVGQLGIEPGAALRRIRDEIVAGPASRMASSAARPTAPSVMVGRQSELAVLRARLADVRQGRGSTVWIEGGPGCGKSALLAAGLADADCQLLWAADMAPLGPADFVDQLAAAGPVVLVADDLQWVDDTNLLVWHRLTKVTRRSPLLLIGACRPLPRRTGIDRLRSAVASGGGDVLRLNGLNDTETAELAALLLGSYPDPGVLAITDCAAGNSRFLREIVDALVRDGAVSANNGLAVLTATPEDGLTLRSVVIRRLSMLTDTTREALRWAAILEPEFDLGDLATVMGHPATELVHAVEEATAADVLSEAGHLFTFRHPLLRHTLYVSMPDAVRTASQRQAAELLRP